jgi:AraC family transcriptional regulator
MSATFSTTRSSTARSFTSPADVARNLGFSADTQLSSPGETVSAAIWRFEAGRTYELEGPASRSNVISMPIIGQCEHTYFGDGRRRWSSTHAPFHVNVVGVGERPRGVFLGARHFWFLHVYVPHILIERVAADSGALAASGSITLTDPMCAPVPGLETICRQIVREMEAPDRCARLMLDALSHALTIRLLRSHSNVAGTSALSAGCAPAARDWRLRRAIDYVEAHVGDDIGLRDIAGAVGLSTTHLTTLFRRGTGEPPHRYLMRRRFERACELLGDPSVSIADVAYRCGFSNSQHLAAVVRQRLGVTPKTYRKQLLS